MIVLILILANIFLADMVPSTSKASAYLRRMMRLCVSCLGVFLESPDFGVADDTWNDLGSVWPLSLVSKKRHLLLLAGVVCLFAFVICGHSFLAPYKKAVSPFMHPLTVWEVTCSQAVI